MPSNHITMHATTFKKRTISALSKTNTSLPLQISNQNNTYCLFKLDLSPV
jgi:hypothetical protein